MTTTPTDGLEALRETVREQVLFAQNTRIDAEGFALTATGAMNIARRAIMEAIEEHVRHEREAAYHDGRNEGYAAGREEQQQNPAMAQAAWQLQCLHETSRPSGYGRVCNDCGLEL